MKTKSIAVPAFVMGTFFCSSTLNAQILTLQPNAADGKDAIVDSRLPANNYGLHQDFLGLAWTNSGAESDVRSFIHFDVSALAPGTVISSAYLTLYNNPTSPNNSGEHSSSSGSNTCVLQKVISAWDENTVTWAMQPSTTVTGQVNIPQTVSLHQDVTVDVTSLVQDMINVPSNNHGFMLKLVTEEYYRAMIFASSDNIDPALHPKLVITYDATGINENKATLTSTQMVPNILAEQSFIEINAEDLVNMTMKVVDMTGKTINLPYTVSGNRMVVNRGTAAAGTYTYQLLQDEKLYSTGKFVIR